MYAKKRRIADTPYAEALNELRAVGPTRDCPPRRRGGAQGRDLYHPLVPLLPQRYGVARVNEMRGQSSSHRFDSRIDAASLTTLADLGLSDVQIARYHRRWGGRRPSTEADATLRTVRVALGGSSCLNRDRSKS